MKSALVIHLKAENTIEWVMIQNDTMMDTIEQHQLPYYLRSIPVILIVPGEDVLLTSINLPELSYAKLLKAIPHAIEDSLAEPIADVHYAVAEHNHSFFLAITSKRKVELWLQSLVDFLKNRNIIFHGTVPSTLALPFSSGAWTIACIDSIALIRTGAYSGFSIEKTELWKILRLMVGQLSALPAVINFISDIHIPQKENLFFKQLNIELKKSIKGPLLSIMAKSVCNIGNINLFENYKTTIIYSKNKIRSATLPLIVLLFSILAFGEIFKVIILARQNLKLTHSISSYLMTLFPNKNISFDQSRVVLKNEIMMLKKARAENNFVLFLQMISPVLSSMPEIQLRSINYKEDVLFLTYTTKDPALIPTLNKKLVALGFKLKEMKAEQSEDSSLITISLGREQ